MITKSHIAAAPATFPKKHTYYKEAKARRSESETGDAKGREFERGGFERVSRQSLQQVRNNFPTTRKTHVEQQLMMHLHTHKSIDCIHAESVLCLRPSYCTSSTIHFSLLREKRQILTFSPPRKNHIYVSSSPCLCLRFVYI